MYEEVVIGVAVSGEEGQTAVKSDGRKRPVGSLF